MHRELITQSTHVPRGERRSPPPWRSEGGCRAPARASAWCRRGSSASSSLPSATRYRGSTTPSPTPTRPTRSTGSRSPAASAACSRRSPRSATRPWITPGYTQGANGPITTQEIRALPRRVRSDGGRHAPEPQRTQDEPRVRDRALPDPRHGLHRDKQTDRRTTRTRRQRSAASTASRATRRPPTGSTRGARPALRRASSCTSTTTRTSSASPPTSRASASTTSAIGETDPRFVHLEMDIYWAYAARNLFPAPDPLDYVQAQPHRYALWHVKDGADRGSARRGRAGVRRRRRRDHRLPDVLRRAGEQGLPPVRRGTGQRTGRQRQPRADRPDNVAAAPPISSASAPRRARSSADGDGRVDGVALPSPAGGSAQRRVRLLAEDPPERLGTACRSLSGPGAG